MEGAERRFGWTPYALRPILKVALATTVLTLISILELLVQLSSKHNGLVDFHGHRAQRYCWSYAGPLILFLLGLAVETFDYGIRAVHPYILFRRAPQPGNRLTYDPLHHSVLTLPFHAIQHRQPLVLVSTLAVLLMLVSKIVVAGLFSIDEITHVTNVELKLDSSFSWNSTTLANTMVSNITAPYLSQTIPIYESGDDAYELPPLHLIVNAGLQLPSRMTPDVAVAALSSNFALPLLSTRSQLTTRLPVVHSDLTNCATVPYRAIRQNTSEDFIIAPELDCVADYGRTSSLPNAVGFSYSVMHDDSEYVGAVFPMPGRTGISDAGLNCSTIFFLFARGNSDINLVSCNYTMTQSVLLPLSTYVSGSRIFTAGPQWRRKSLLTTPAATMFYR